MLPKTPAERKRAERERKKGIVVKTQYLDNRCLWCNELLHASTHQSAKERKRRDDKKVYCGGPCAARHKAQQIDGAMNQFIYAGARR